MFILVLEFHIPVLQTLYLTFGFEDLLYEEISWKTLGAEFFPKPHLASVTEGRI